MKKLEASSKVTSVASKKIDRAAKMRDMDLSPVPNLRDFGGHNKQKAASACRLCAAFKPI
jgi:hypothetical protein